MGRKNTDAAISTPAQRSRLPERDEPFWRQIHQGLHLGYRKGRWIVRCTEHGRKSKKSIGQADDKLPADGEIVLDFKQATTKALERASAPAPGGYTVDRAWRAYIDDYNVRSGADTYNLGLAYTKYIEPKFGHKRLDDLTTNMIKTWLNDLARTEDPDRARAKKATANKQLTKLKACLNFAYENGRTSNKKVWDRIKPFKNVDAPRIRFISADEVKGLIEHAEDEFKPLICAAVLTGCRWSELTRLQVADVSEASIHIATSKSGKARDVPLSAEGQAFFTEQVKNKVGFVFTIDGEPVGKSMQHRRMKAACKGAKIVPAISFHLLRHYYASALVQVGVSLQVVAVLLGHADTRTTEKHYAHLQPKDVAMILADNLPEIIS